MISKKRIFLEKKTKNLLIVFKWRCEREKGDEI